MAKKSKEGKKVQKDVTKMIKKLVSGIEYVGEVEHLNQLGKCKSGAKLGHLRLVRNGATKFVRMADGESCPSNEAYTKDGRKYTPVQVKQGDTEWNASNLVESFRKTKDKDAVYMWNGSKFIKVCNA